MNNTTVYINSRFLTQPITGVQRYGIEISKELKLHLKDKIKLIAPSNIIHKNLVKELDVEIIGKHTGHLWEQIDLPNYLKKKGSPLLVNLCNTAPLLYKNKISTIHDVAFNLYPKTYSKSFLYLYKFIIPRIIRSSLKVITVSQFSKNEITKYYKVPDKKIHVVYNAVNNSFIKKRDHILEKEKYVLSVFSLNHRKNIIPMLESYSNIETDVKLFLIGDLSTKSFSKINIQKYIDDKRIQFLGRISDEELVKFYSNALAFIYPSTYEGFGIPPLEAQKCGCAVITSDILCFKEIFEESVLFCDPFNASSIRNSILTMINDDTLRNVIIEKGFENVNRFSWYNSALSLETIINSISK